MIVFLFVVQRGGQLGRVIENFVVVNYECDDELEEDFEDEVLLENERCVLEEEFDDIYGEIE